MILANRAVTSCFTEILDFTSDVCEGLRYIAEDVWNAVSGFFLQCAEMFQKFFGCTCFSPALPTVISASQRKTVDVLSEEPSAEICRGLKVNKLRINDAPKPIDLPVIEQAISNAQPPIDYLELLAHFNACTHSLSEEDEFCVDEDGPVSVKEARETLETSYVTYTNNYGGYKKEEENIKPLIKQILLAFRKPETSLVMVREVFEDLVRAGLHCTPGRHTPVEKACKKVRGQIDTLDEIILQLLQVVKEDLFLAFYTATRQSSHTLNRIRMVVGEELGLNCSPIHFQDANIGAAGARFKDGSRTKEHSTRKEFLDTFDKIYTPQNILRAMQLSLNSKIAKDPDLQVMVTQFLDGEMRQSEDDPVTDELLKDYVDFSRQCQLKMEGVKYLLVHHRFLN